LQSRAVLLKEQMTGGITMNSTYARLALLTCVLSAGKIFAADPVPPAVSRMHDRELSSLERELVPLAEAMPADKFEFAPTNGSFEGVRTFRLQMSHIATVIYEVSAGILGEKAPIDVGKNENGPDSLKAKEDVVRYLKDAFAYSHKAMNSLTGENITGLVDSPFGGKASRASLASIAIWHSYDHYGQSVVYARLCGTIPPASRK
jgi:uncharacterized damage-inducible protein DinB